MCTPLTYLEEQLKPLERQLQHGVVEVLQVKRPPGQLLCIQMTRGSKRPRQGDQAVWLRAYPNNWYIVGYEHRDSSEALARSQPQ